MSATRREFLAGSAALVASTAVVPRLWADIAWRAARSGDSRVLVVVQLSGGNDGLNSVIPYGDDAYHRSRFATRIEANAVVRIDDYLGWHPALRGFADLQEQSRIAIVQGVGYPQPNRSHFESMDIWHSARLQPPHRSGWLGRWLDQSVAAAEAAAQAQAIRALHLGDEPLPLAMTGLQVMVPSLRTIDGLRVRADRAVDAALGQFPAEGWQVGGDSVERSELLEFVRTTRSTALQAAQRLARIQLQPAEGYDGSPLARKLASVAQLIAVDFGPRVYYVELTGFDTHSQQAAAHAALLGELGNAVAAFYRDLDTRGLSDQVLTMCFSEFGRRVRENGSAGTDHGTAAPLWLIGPAGLPLRLGRYPSLVDLDEGDLIHTVDFRCVYATVLEKWLGVSSQEILGAPYDLLPVWNS